MVIGTLRVELLIREARSLKDKRRVLSSIKDRLRHQFNVSVAEVDHEENYQHAALGIALVTNEARYAQQLLQQILQFLRVHAVAELTTYELETF
jgi:uncharacterized protein YlxP (DUF503 family)